LKLVANIKEALLNLFSSKLRSALALLGILVGTASVVAMVSGGELATNEALKQFKILGTDLLAITINDVPSDDSKEGRAEQNITLQQALAMATVNKAVRDIAPYTQLYSPIQYNGHAINGSILGVTENLQHVIHINMASGRFISSLDKYSLFCVIGQHLYEEIKKITSVEPLGQQIQLGNDFFMIVGVAKPWQENSFVYANIDNAILVPILASTALSKYALINNIIVKLSPEANLEQVNNDMNKYINQILPSKRLYFRSAKELIASMAKQSSILTVFLGLIGSISLIVGGIGVMNIMLVSVVERRREIGIRLAVGARRADIRALFLIEAIMLALVGGVTGVVIGLVIEYIIALLWHWEFILFILPPLIGFFVSVAIGIFFGFYPAYKASQLDPIEALRSEQ
jgi:putative ABC transport system permease protein